MRMFLPVANKNKFKQFTIAPKSPPRRVLLEIQRVRAAPDPQLPDPDDDNDSGKLFFLNVLFYYN